MNSLTGLRGFVRGWLARIAINLRSLDEALERLEHFQNLSSDERSRICETLIRNGEVLRLVNRVRSCPEMIPHDMSGFVYRALCREIVNPHEHAFVKSEILRLQQVLACDAWVYRRRSMSTEQELALVRLCRLLEALGLEGRETAFELALVAYEAFSWLPDEISDRHISRILIETAERRSKASKPKKMSAVAS